MPTTDKGLGLPADYWQDKAARAQRHLDGITVIRRHIYASPELGEALAGLDPEQFGAMYTRIGFDAKGLCIQESNARGDLENATARLATYEEKSA